MVSETLFALEKKLLEPPIRKNREELEALLAIDFLEFASSGTVWTKQEMIDALIEDKNENPYQATDFRFHELADSAAFITYKTIQIRENGSRSEALRSSVWKLNSNGWQMVFHQGTPLGTA